MTTTTERDLHREIAALLTMHGVTFGHARFGVRCHYTPGWPDFTYAIRGQAWGVEVKTATGKLDPEQVRVHARLREEGWRIAVVRSVEEARALLPAYTSDRPPVPMGAASRRIERFVERATRQ